MPTASNDSAAVEASVSPEERTLEKQQLTTNAIEPSNQNTEDAPPSEKGKDTINYEEEVTKFDAETKGKDGKDGEGETKKSGEKPPNDKQDKKRPAEDEHGPLPTLPLKRARTAYFVFADEKRHDVKKQHPGEGVGVIAKAIGQLWSQMDSQSKEKYDAIASEERQRVARYTQRLKDAGLWPEKGSESASASVNDDALIFPIGRIRKICRLDPEVKGSSKEATLLITKATELFCAKLGRECVTMAQMSNRRKLLPDDVVQVSAMKERFMFLKPDLVDLQQLQQEEAKEKGSNKKTGGDASATASGSNILSYFGKPSEP